MNIAFISDEIKRPLMAEFCAVNKEILAGHRIISTAETGKSIETESGLSVERLMSENYCRFQEIESRISNGEIDLVIYFRVATAEREESRNTYTVIRLCDLYGIPIATNIPTARLLMAAVARGDFAAKAKTNKKKRDNN